jgi:hypothetical protein
MSAPVNATVSASGQNEADLMCWPQPAIVALRCSCWPRELSVPLLDVLNCSSGFFLAAAKSFAPRGQAFSAGLVDEIAMDVAPLVLGEGVRFFGSHAGTVFLDDPDQVVRGDRVLHLHYTLQR